DDQLEEIPERLLHARICPGCDPDAWVAARLSSTRSGPATGVIRDAGVIPTARGVVCELRRISWTSCFWLQAMSQVMCRSPLMAKSYQLTRRLHASRVGSTKSPQSSRSTPQTAFSATRNTRRF